VLLGTKKFIYVLLNKGQNSDSTKSESTSLNAQIGAKI